MKISLLITEQGNQITMTPADGDKREIALLDMLADGKYDIAIHKGVDFAMTQANYLRGFNHEPVSRSVAITMTPKQEAV